ncbi:MAG: HesA/MoeB/ThiF family protein [Bacteroidales bacterium]|nr:HesA/MoeB/ThiF family protein [Bacteroidales bacterium]
MDKERYQRQIMLPDFGEAGQEKLSSSKILIVGAGGLGSPVATYLTAAGVGKIFIADNDEVSVSNLPRQILYDTSQQGQSKVECAAARLTTMNPNVCIVPIARRFENSAFWDEIADGLDLVVDCTDNYASRYEINDFCIRHKLPMVYAAIEGTNGQVAVLCHSAGRATYKTLFPKIPDTQPRKEVLSTTPGVVGTVQATQVLMLLAGFGKPLIDKLWSVDLLTMTSFCIDL